ncbi:MAG: glutathione synthase [Francisellaceae bacterium]|jgi:glutathione synthase
MKILFIIDPIENLIAYKDTTVMMMQETSRRGWETYISTLDEMLIHDGNAYTYSTPVTPNNDPKNWYELGKTEKFSSTEFDIIMMRKEPPFDMEFVYATYILDIAEKNGSKVVNSPAALRNYNEKCHITHFPEFTPLTLITKKKEELLQFIDKHENTIIKPLDGMGGASIFRIQKGDANTNVILETITNYFTNYVMAQIFNPEIKKGDKRILIVDGKPLDYVLARVPAKNDFRGNIAAGATSVVQNISPRNKEIANAVGQHLKKNNILFAGIDLIGDTMTEINITCPTCAREIFIEKGIDATKLLFDSLER